MKRSPFGRLERLARRVTAGEVVFFVGAGFSVDSEGNTGERLISRLAVRFEILTYLLITELLEPHTGQSEELRRSRDSTHQPFATAAQIRQVAQDLRNTLLTTFRLEKGRRAQYPTLLSENISKLGADYYNINDWMSTAYGVLIQSIASLANAGALTKKAAELEKQLLKGLLFEITERTLKELKNIPADVRIKMEKLRRVQFAGEEKWNKFMARVLGQETWKELGPQITRTARRSFGAAVSPQPDYAALATLGELAGKALFLDTMGFADPRVMCGKPEDKSPDDVMKSFRSALRPRHYVLARMAREGWCPTLLTTNYDLLIEGAYRLAGFELTSSRNNPPGTETGKFDRAETLLPTMAFRRCVRVADAIQFFDHCVDHGSAQIFKIHGCVDQYRAARNAPAQWKYYLPAMVFTYREVQNWRGDSWSRDLLSTLLRTRTIAFLGYSAADPVIHDTFRTVYEEMAIKRAAFPMQQAAILCPKLSEDGELPGSDAPGFFFGNASRREFHGLEILRAASRTVGPASTDLTDHPNYIDFFYEEEREHLFPTLDEALLWLYHCTLRNLQTQTIDTDLRRAGTMLLRHPCDPRHVEAIRENFVALRESESHYSNKWSPDARHRAQFRRIVNWTNHFHVNLLRELGLGEIIQREARPNFALGKLRRWPWYFPASENRDWTAWSVVTEIALRRMIATWRSQEPREWLADTPWVRAVDWERTAAIAFSRDEKRPAPILLRLRATTFDRIPPSSSMPGVRTCITWDLHPNCLPWRMNAPGGASSPRTVTIPSAEQMWAWAHGLEPQKCDISDLESFLGPRYANN